MKLNFYKYDNRWFVNLPNTDFSEEEREMVAGADIMCDIYSQGKDSLFLDINTEYTEDYDLYERLNYDYSGAVYSSENFAIWLCALTKYVFGSYPEKLYIKPLN